MTLRTWPLWAVLAATCAALAIFSYRYLPAVGPLAPNVLANLFARPWLAVHVVGAATALLVGPVQLLPALRRRRGAHRWFGRIYALACLVGGVGGLFMAFGVTAGPVAGLGFGLLAVAWLYATAQGWRLAVAGRFAEHREWMMRSFAMTFAAVTLRLYLPLSPMVGVDFVTGYRLCAWISWIPNVIALELYLRGPWGVRARSFATG